MVGVSAVESVMLTLSSTPSGNCSSVFPREFSSTKVAFKAETSDARPIRGSGLSFYKSDNIPSDETHYINVTNGDQNVTSP